MANFKMVEPVIGAPSPATATYSTAAWPLGYEAKFADQQSGSANLGAGVFVYCQGSNVASAGQLVHIVNNSAVLLDSANSASFYPIGLAATALSATNVYGWVQVQGLADYGRQTNSSGGAGIRLALASTAGQFGTVTALGSRIHGLICPVSFTSSQSASITLQLQRPFVVGITASN